MKTVIAGRIVELVLGDISEQDVDAIVSAANSSLQGGGGVDGAIHRAAGPQLAEAGRRLAPCPPGEARITPGFDLAARYVIHTVGPVYRGGGRREADVLASAHRESLRLADEHALSTIAFPAISTGVYGYPVADAAPIAVATVAEHLGSDTSVTLVRFVLFDETTFDVFASALAQLDT